MTVRRPRVSHGVHIGFEQMEMKAILIIISTCYTPQRIQTYSTKQAINGQEDRVLTSRGSRDDGIIFMLFTISLLARDSMLSALYAIARTSVCLSVRLSVRLSHGWISQKRLNVSSKFFYHLIGPTF